MQVNDIVNGIIKYLENIGEAGRIGEVGKELIKISQKRSSMTVVETAIPIEKKLVIEIEKLVGKAEFKVNRDLLGGIKVTSGDKQIDLSIRKRLEDIYAA